MEHFKVSGAELRNFYQKETVLAQVFQDIENDLKAVNQVVCRYIVNGMELDESEESKFSAVSLQDIQTLEYLAENSANLVETVLKGWIDALPELIERTENLAQKMRVQGLSGQLKHIHDLVENCEILIDSIIPLKGMVGDQFLVSSPVDWSTAELLSKKTMQEALRALQDKDFVLLADVIEYDLNNVLQIWLDSLKVLEKTIHGESSGPYPHAQETGSHSMGRKRIAN